VITGVIFDLGSTLIHFDGNWQAVFEESLHALARQLEADGLAVEPQALRAEFRRQVEVSQALRQQDNVERTSAWVLRQVLEAVGAASVDEGALDRALGSMFAASEARWVPMPGLHDVLSALRAGGYRLGLISNASDEANVRRLLAQAGLTGAFHPELISAAVGIRKPDVRLFQQVLTAWGTPPQSVVMVGDTLGEDILGAQRAGLRTIWFTADADTPANRMWGTTLRPDAAADDLCQLPALIRSLDGGPPHA
jgi:putative hydrolase of the HAD superfamily